MVQPSYPSLFWSYLRIGATAFGGGLAALPVFEAELAGRRRWLAHADVAEAFAISQSIPGVIIVNLAVLSGLRIGGKRAAVVAAITVVLPAFFLILALAAFFGERWDNRWVAGALAGLRPAVVALLAAAAIRLVRVERRSWLWWLAAGTCTVLLLAHWLGPVPAILAGACAGLVLHGYRQWKRGSP